MHKVILFLIVAFIMAGCGAWHHHRGDCPEDCRAASGTASPK
jgi:hypothetical protein